MATKLKMKIGNRILFSYIALLFVVFLIAGFISTRLVENRMMIEARDELRVQSEGIVTMLEESKFDLTQPRRIGAFFKNSNVMGLFSADVFVLDPNKKIIYASNEELSENTLRAIVEDKNTNYIRAFKEVSFDNELYGYFMMVLDVKYIDQSVRVLRNGLLIGFAIAGAIALIIAFIMRSRIVRPIKQLESQMQEVIKNPEHDINVIRTGDELESLSESFKKMSHTILSNMDERKRFFQNASHELKTPLMSIQGYAEAIRDGVVEGEEVNESLDIIINKSQQLKRTVEEVIYLSKLMNSDFEYKFELVDVGMLIQECMDDQKLLAQDKGIQLVYDRDESAVVMKLDKDKMSSVMNNLISNGLRYAKSLIRVQLVNENSRIIIRVLDDGEGFKNDEQLKIFERFYKGDGGKSGIGLAIVKEIVNSHQGFIRADNHIAGGAAFEIILNKEA